MNELFALFIQMGDLYWRNMNQTECGTSSKRFSWRKPRGNWDTIFIRKNFFKKCAVCFCRQNSIIVLQYIFFANNFVCRKILYNYVHKNLEQKIIHDLVHFSGVIVQIVYFSVRVRARVRVLSRGGVGVAARRLMPGDGLRRDKML